MSDDGAGPKDPLTGLLQGATVMHEIFRTYMAAGFTESQALYLIGVLTAAVATGSPKAP
jgi:hypothetical protein